MVARAEAVGKKFRVITNGPKVSCEGEKKFPKLVVVMTAKLHEYSKTT